MFEKIVEDKENRKEFLEKVLAKVKDNIGDDIPEIAKELREIAPFFTEDKYFVKDVNHNFKRLKQAFKDEEFERALTYVRARKVRNHVMRRAEEALGYREIANNKFNTYQIVAKRIEPVIKKDILIEKTNFTNTLFALTTDDGFKEIDNFYYKEIVNKGKEIITQINENGYYDPSLCEVELEHIDEETKKTILLPIRLTCEKNIPRRKRY